MMLSLFSRYSSWNLLHTSCFLKQIIISHILNTDFTLSLSALSLFKDTQGFYILFKDTQASQALVISGHGKNTYKTSRSSHLSVTMTADGWAHAVIRVTMKRNMRNGMSVLQARSHFPDTA